MALRDLENRDIKMNFMSSCLKCVPADRYDERFSLLPCRHDLTAGAGYMRCKKCSEVLIGIRLIDFLTNELQMLRSENAELRHSMEDLLVDHDDESSRVLAK